MLAVTITSGGRSAIISFIVALGGFFFLHRFWLTSRATKNTNIAVGLLYLAAIIVAAIVSSFYAEGDSLTNGLLIIFNRIFAAPDGTEYYLKYGGEINIDSGIGPYLNSIFGIYIQNITGIPYKNIGWQLTELAVGDVEFAQGSNYTILLQAMVFNQYLAPAYGMAAGWLIARLRYLNPSNPWQLFLVYTISIVCFTFSIDAEYFTLLIISATAFYFFIAIPIFRIKAQ